MSIYIKKILKKRVERVQVHTNSWNETAVNKAKQQVLKEFAEFIKNQYKVSSDITEYKYISSYKKTPVPNIDKTIIIRLGGPFEQIGGKDEAVGSGSQKVGTGN